MTIMTVGYTLPSLPGHTRPPNKVLTFNIFGLDPVEPFNAPTWVLEVGVFNLKVGYHWVQQASKYTHTHTKKRVSMSLHKLGRGPAWQYAVHLRLQFCMNFPSSLNHQVQNLWLSNNKKKRWNGVRSVTAQFHFYLFKKKT